VRYCLTVARRLACRARHTLVAPVPPPAAGWQLLRVVERERAAGRGSLLYVVQLITALAPADTAEFGAKHAFNVVQ